LAARPISVSAVATSGSLASPALAFDAVIFDMDGVLTRTSAVHAVAWKRTFDGFLRERALARGEPFRAFDHPRDYLAHVDGRPRYHGVESFLGSRGIALPFGAVEDLPDAATVCGLGNRKNELFNQIIAEEGVGVHDSTVALIRELRARRLRVGLATSSRNASLILARVNLAHLFDTAIDGVVAALLGLRGKPEPDIFATACARLGVDPARAIVVEDAISGVQAGARGGFALTVGVAREGNARELRENGADLVVADLAETSLDELNRLVCTRGQVSRAS
jgi:beta-phosphoglucomutase family hydrolase